MNAKTQVNSLAKKNLSVVEKNTIAMQMLKIHDRVKNNLDLVMNVKKRMSSADKKRHQLENSTKSQIEELK